MRFPETRSVANDIQLFFAAGTDCLPTSHSVRRTARCSCLLRQGNLRRLAKF